MEVFKNDDDIKVLVAVQQGREGFDFEDLENVIDMTYSKNFSVVMQIIGRLLRKNKDIPKKFFFKVAPKHTHSYFVDWMNALFMLFGLEWYSTFDGKNGFDIKFPKFDENEGKKKEKPRTPPGPGGPRQPGTFKPTNLSKFNSLEFMSKNKWFKLNDVMSTVAYTTLGDISRKHRSDEALTLKAKKYIDDKIDLADAYLKGGVSSLYESRKFQNNEFYINEFANKHGITFEESTHFLQEPIKKIELERDNMLLNLFS